MLDERRDFFDARERGGPAEDLDTSRAPLTEVGFQTSERTAGGTKLEESRRDLPKVGSTVQRSGVQLERDDEKLKKVLHNVS